jgi:hypothetical protein
VVLLVVAVVVVVMVLLPKVLLLLLLLLLEVHHTQLCPLGQVRGCAVPVFGIQLLCYAFSSLQAGYPEEYQTFQKQHRCHR